MIIILLGLKLYKEVRLNRFFALICSSQQQVHQKMGKPFRSSLSNDLYRLKNKELNIFYDVNKRVIQININDEYSITSSHKLGNGELACVETKEESKYILRDDLVSMQVNKDTLTNSKGIFKLVNHTKETYIYGEPYCLEYESAGIWYELKPLNELFFNLPAYYLKPQETKEKEYDWSLIYGHLMPGKYRIIISVFSEEDIPITKEKEVYIGAEFTISL